MIIREEISADIAGIRSVNQAAFKDEAASRLVDTLRKNGKLVISLVAEEDGKVIGHIAFSGIFAEPSVENGRILGLAPLAVVPCQQKRGIGSMLVKNGMEQAKCLGYTHLVVLGGGYYHRFGFVSARQYGIGSAYNAGDHFMIIALTETAMPVDVTMNYEPEFAECGC